MPAAMPIRPDERIISLDIMRGFALLGILVMNVTSFSGTDFTAPGVDEQNTFWLDSIAGGFRDIFFSGKFNSLFSFLFAIGFTIQLSRLQNNSPTSTIGVYWRRIALLFLIGWLHGSVFWTGDVLHSYAVLGVLLFMVRNWAERSLVTLLVLCLLYPAFRSLALVLFAPPEWGPERLAVYEELIESAHAAYGSGSFVDIVSHNSAVMLAQYTDAVLIDTTLLWYVIFFTTMLLGLIVSRRQWIQNAASNLPLITKTQWWSFGAGIVFSISAVLASTLATPAEPSVFWIVFRLTYGLARICIMLFYVATILRLAQTKRWRHWLMPLAAAGRMPLSNYLLQTLICTFIFYNWGLGFWNTTGIAIDLAIAFAIFFLVQVPLSMWWFGRYNYGPMEYLWRALSYGKRPARRS